MATTMPSIRIFDGERVTSDSAVRLHDGLIVAVGGPEQLEPGDEHVDGGGGTVLPGLIDAHVHLLSGSPKQAVTFGVTTVLDMFSKPRPRAGSDGAGCRTERCGRALVERRGDRAGRAPVADVRAFPLRHRS
ncbi:hypothetical protein [Allokutzneria oryzae]|uniref:Amidohydrolase family protein n=1 Tax=Allokutzneria oryzae TaxID=1378989 RepID=A0ABV6A466_9PSEU